MHGIIKLALGNLKFESQIRTGQHCLVVFSMHRHGCTNELHAEEREKRMRDNAVCLKRSDKDESWGKGIRSRVED